MSTKFWMSLVAVVAMASFALVGVAEDKKAGPVNAKCPFSGKEINPEATLDIKVGFCCNNCKGKGEKDQVAVLNKIAPAKSK